MVLAKFKRIDISSSYESLKDLLLENWSYSKSFAIDWIYSEEASQYPVLKNFLIDLLEDDLQKDLSSRSISKLDNSSTNALRLYHLMRYIIKDKLNSPDWAVQNSLYVNLLIHELENQDLYASANELKTAYLQHPDIAPLIKAHILNLVDKKVEKEEETTSPFILISEDKKHGLVFPQELYEAYLCNSTNTVKDAFINALEEASTNDSEDISAQNTFTNTSAKNPSSPKIFWYTKHAEEGYEAQASKNLYDALQPFPVLLDQYLDQQNKLYTSGFLSLFKLGEYKELFEQTIQKGECSKSLVAAENQKNLKAIFRPFMLYKKPTKGLNKSSAESSSAHSLLPINKEATLTRTHFDEIVSNYIPLTAEGKNKEECYAKTAQMFFVLSTLFTLLSSDKFFGTRAVVPKISTEEIAVSSIALRQYAVALLNEAQSLDKNLFKALDKKIQEEKLKDIKDLKGLETAQSATQSTSYDENTFDAYRNRLAGERTYTYSNIHNLSNRMLIDIKNMAAGDAAFQKIFSAVFPRHWLKNLSPEKERIV